MVAILGQQFYEIQNFGRFTIATSNAIAFHPLNPDTVFAVKELQAVVYRSVNGGADWDSLSKPPGIVNTDAMRAITIAPDSTHIMLLSGRRSVVFRSTDAGKTWDGSVTLPGLQPDTDLSCFRWSPSQQGTVYAVAQTSIAANTTNGGLHKSTDYGLTWERIKAVDTSLFAMEIFPTASGDEIFLGGNVIAQSQGAVVGRGIVFRTPNGTQNWQDLSEVPWAPLEDGSMVKNVWGFARTVSADGTPYVYMATEAGLYRTAVVTSIQRTSEVNSTPLYYKNSTIETLQPELSDASLRVYSSMGELLFSTSLQNGRATLPTDVSGVLAIQVFNNSSILTTMVQCVR